MKTWDKAQAYFKFQQYTEIQELPQYTEAYQLRTYYGKQLSITPIITKHEDKIRVFIKFNKYEKLFEYTGLYMVFTDIQMAYRKIANQLIEQGFNLPREFGGTWASTICAVGFHFNFRDNWDDRMKKVHRESDQQIYAIQEFINEMEYEEELVCI